MDPYVRVDLLGKEKRSTVKKDVTQDAKVKIDEHLFLEYKNLEKEEISNSQILF